MPPKLSPSAAASSAQRAPMSHKIIVGTIAILLGGYVTYKAGSDFQFVKYTPHSPEEIERRKRENQTGISMKMSEELTLDLKPEAKQRIQKLLDEKNKSLDENQNNKD